MRPWAGAKSVPPRSGRKARMAIFKSHVEYVSTALRQQLILRGTSATPCDEKKAKNKTLKCIFHNLHIYSNRKPKIRGYMLLDKTNLFT